MYFQCDMIHLFGVINTHYYHDCDVFSLWYKSLYFNQILSYLIYQVKSSIIVHYNSTFQIHVTLARSRRLSRVSNALIKKGIIQLNPVDSDPQGEQIAGRT